MLTVDQFAKHKPYGLREIRAVAAAVARVLDVEVVLKGARQGYSTDGKVVFADSSPKTRRGFRIAAGAMIHEAAHVRFKTVERMLAARERIVDNLADQIDAECEKFQKGWAKLDQGEKARNLWLGVAHSFLNVCFDITDETQVGMAFPNFDDKLREMNLLMGGEYQFCRSEGDAMTVHNALMQLIIAARLPKDACHYRSAVVQGPFADLRVPPWKQPVLDRVAAGWHGLMRRLSNIEGQGLNRTEQDWSFYETITQTWLSDLLSWVVEELPDDPPPAGSGGGSGGGEAEGDEEGSSGGAQKGDDGDGGDNKNEEGGGGDKKDGKAGKGQSDKEDDPQGIGLPKDLGKKQRHRKLEIVEGGAGIGEGKRKENETSPEPRAEQAAYKATAARMQELIQTRFAESEVGRADRGRRMNRRWPAMYDGSGEVFKRVEEYEGEALNLAVIVDISASTVAFIKQLTAVSRGVASAAAEAGASVRCWEFAALYDNNEVSPWEIGQGGFLGDGTAPSGVITEAVDWLVGEETGRRVLLILTDGRLPTVEQEATRAALDRAVGNRVQTAILGFCIPVGAVRGTWARRVPVFQVDLDRVERSVDMMIDQITEGMEE